MLELFFDDEKVFAVFEQILKDKNLKVNVSRICFDLGIEPATAVSIIQSFEFLGILKETDDSPEYFLFDPTSEVVLAICLFDDMIAKYCLKNIGDDGDRKGKDINEPSFEDFIDMIKENGIDL